MSKKIDKEYISKKYKNLDKHRKKYKAFMDVTSIDDLLDDVPIKDIPNTLNKIIKESWAFKNKKWPDGSKLALKDCTVRYEKFWEHVDFKIVAEKEIPETNEMVIKRLINNEKAKVRSANQKATKEKWERTMYEKLKKKFEDV